MKKCPFCGTEIEVDAVFCPACGAHQESVGQSSDAVIEPVATEPTVAEPTVTEPVMNEPAVEVPAAETTVLTAPATFNEAAVNLNQSIPAPSVSEQFVGGAEKKKKSKKKIIIPIVVAALVVILAGGFFARGALLQMVLPADKYVQNSVKAWFGKNAESASEYVGEIKNAQNGSSHVAADLGLNIDDSAIDKLEEYMEEIGLGGILPEDTLKKFDSVNVKMDLAADGKLMKATAGAYLNGKELMAGDVIADPEAGNVFVKVPEICDDWGKIETDEYDLSENEKTAEEVKKLIPSAELTEKIINRYGEIIADSMKNVEKASETVKAGGISEKVNAYKVTYTPEEYKALVMKIIDTLKTDEDVKAIIKNIENSEKFGEEGEYDNFVYILDDLKEDIEDGFSEKLTITIYIDTWGNFAGLKIKSGSDGWNEASFVIPHDGDKIGVCASFYANEYVYEKIEGQGIYKSGKLSLNLTEQSSGEETCKIEIINMICNDKETSGEMKFSFPAAGEDFAFGVKFEKSKKASAKIEVLVYNKNTPMISVYLAVASQKADKKIEIPEKTITVDEWSNKAGSADIDKKLEKSLNDAGITEKDVESLADIIVGIQAMMSDDLHYYEDDPYIDFDEEYWDDLLSDQYEPEEGLIFDEDEMKDIFGDAFAGAIAGDIT